VRLVLDLLIAGGTVADGTGNPLFQADVGIEDGKIAYVGRGPLPRSARVIDASGLIVAPGFVDVHTHSDISLIKNPGAEYKLLQGVTTEVLGNCGLSVAPLSAKHKQETCQYVGSLFGDLGTDWPWNTVGDYLGYLESAEPALNAATMVGHGVLRLAVMGFDPGPASPEQLDHMKSLVSRAMEEGALGLSTGLQYAPGSYATLDELIDLSRTVARLGGIYATHMRSQGTGLLESLRDVISIAATAHVPVQVSHLLAMGEVNWPKYDEALKMIREARKQGLDITWDMYPYDAGCTMLRVTLPPWVMDGGVEEALRRLTDPATRGRIKLELKSESGDWDNISLVAGWHNLVPIQLASMEHQHLVGRSLQDIASLKGMDPAESTMDLLVRERTGGTMVAFVSSEENIQKALSAPYGMVGSDSLHTENGMVHPRTYGCYPRFFGQYVREKGLLTIEEAVRKATALPAARFGLYDRGLLRPGSAADVAIFDLSQVNDRATYHEPRRLADGVLYLVVNGVLAVEDGRPTGKRAGRVLRSAVSKSCGER